MNNIIATATQLYNLLLARENNPVPVATTNQGYILYSNNAQKPGLPLQNISNMRAAVLSQTPYTDNTRQYLASIPIAISTSGGGGEYGRGVGIRLNPLGTGSALRHEFIHATDANINAPIQSSYGPLLNQGRFASNSYNFYNNLAKQNDPESKYASQFSNNAFYQPQTLQGGRADPYIQNTESLAEYGAQGSPALLSSVGNYFKNVYNPYEINPNATYPQALYKFYQNNPNYQ